MKTCLDCRYADWDTTKTGRLSPTGGGRCKYEFKAQPLPNSMSFAGWSGNVLLLGGHINRKKKFVNDCPCYQEEAAK